jgi:trimeric autotransporter adhesin
VVQLDSNGAAVVTLPDWFSALNSDFRYQLTAIGPSKSVLYIDQEISNNQFKIGGGTARMKVSWQVTGIRQDAWANAYRIPVEENKPASSRGLYHHPELFGHHKEKGIAYHAAPAAPITPTSANTIPPTKP